MLVNPKAWGADFTKPLTSVLTLAEAAAVPHGLDHVRVVGCDATLQLMGATDWRAGVFLRLQARVLVEVLRALALEWDWITEFILPDDTWTASETTLLPVGAANLSTGQLPPLLDTVMAIYTSQTDTAIQKSTFTLVMANINSHGENPESMQANLFAHTISYSTTKNEYM